MAIAHLDSTETQPRDSPGSRRFQGDETLAGQGAFRESVDVMERASLGSSHGLEILRPVSEGS